MRVLVTGANGFLGRHVVAALLERGHTVRAQVRRRPAPGDLPPSPAVELVHAELLAPSEGLATCLVDVDVVVHLAAAMTGSLPEQLVATVGGTERVLEAMGRARCRRMVLASSLAVYDWSASGDALDEQTPLVDPEVPHGRDAYAIAKTIQERLAYRIAAERGYQLTVLRPGFIWGSGHEWLAGLGPSLGRLHFVVGPDGPIPITHVENCADAFAFACERPEAAGRAVNVVDDGPVTAWQYLGDLLARSSRRGFRVPVPYAGAWGAVRSLHALAGCLPGLRARLPGVLVPGCFEARFKRLRFPNDAAGAALGWRPRRSYAECLQRIPAAAAATSHEART